MNDSFDVLLKLILPESIEEYPERTLNLPEGNFNY